MGAGEFFYWALAPSSAANDADIIKRAEER